MRKIVNIFCVLAITLSVVSCACSDEPLGKRIAKKTAQVGLDAIEGVAEALEEKGAQVGEKTMDAFGTLAEGIGKSVDRQLNEHTVQIANVAGRTLVQSLEGLEGGFNEAYYDPYTVKENVDDNVITIFIGKIKEKPVVDARFFTIKKGEYSFKFEFYSNQKIVFTKEVTDTVDEDRKQSVISFYLTDEEVVNTANTQYVKVTANKK